MTSRLVAGLAASAIAVSGFASPSTARDRIQIVGSSTVFPFSVAVAERFARTGFEVPVVDSTGSGGGLTLFCAGVGDDTPDIVNASRPIKESEVEACRANGASPLEVKVGFDGIVLSNARSGPQFSVTREQIFMALAKQLPGGSGSLVANPHANWSDIDPTLPDERIEVLGPPPTSGTRDAFVELVMDAACPADVPKDKCAAIREDGAYIEAGENDDLIVQALEANPAAVGIFGFSYLDRNADRIRGAAVDGVAPTFERIASGEYPLSRLLYFYIKQEHVGAVPGIREYVGEFVSEAAFGDDGYLASLGLIPLPAAERDASRAAIETLPPLPR